MENVNMNTMERYRVTGVTDTKRIQNTNYEFILPFGLKGQKTFMISFGGYTTKKNCHFNSFLAPPFFPQPAAVPSRFSLAGPKKKINTRMECRVWSTKRGGRMYINTMVKTFGR